ncbi:MAG: peptide-methionine (R)-S-oxide reductase, partial [Chloroflexota bacterium]
MTNKITKTEADWRAELTPEQYHVLRQKGTERAFSGALWDEHRPGTYRCAGCGAELFDAATKFESGTGWPSFYEPMVGDAVDTETDRSFFMT